MSRSSRSSTGSGLRRTLIGLTSVITLFAVTASGMSASSPSRSVKIGGTVTIDNVQGFLWTCGFNPYSSSTALLSAGIIYEPLWYVNQDNGHNHPWLAQRYSWGKGNRTLTFVLRSGVKWTDGKPLTPADVVFTFKLLKKYPAIDVNAVWTVLSKVAAAGSKITFTFKQPGVPFFYYIADQTFILPQHLWSSVSNPITYTDTKPVGSGPFMLNRCSPQNIEYVRNPHYWQPGKPYLDKVEYPGFIDNTGGNNFLFSRKDVWGAQYIPNVKVFYLAHGSNRHIWFPPQGYDTVIYPNLKAWPTNILAVRQAISYGLDRRRVSQRGVYGYLPPANQSGIITPNWKKWYDKALANKYSFGFRPRRAIRILKGAGFKRGSDGIFHDKRGRKLDLSIVNVGGYSDWVAENQIIAADLKQVGINLTVLELSGNTHSAREQQGQFQLAYDSPLGGPEPYYQFRQLLDSANSAPLGKLASSNYERFTTQQVDQWFNQYAATKSLKVQKSIIDKLQSIMLTQLPVIPVLEGVNWYEYDTNDLTGWPTKKNEYAAPAAYNYPDQAQVLMSLHLK